MDPADFTERDCLSGAVGFGFDPAETVSWQVLVDSSAWPELQHGDQHGHCAESQAFDHLTIDVLISTFGLTKGESNSRYHWVLLKITQVVPLFLVRLPA